MYRDHPVIDADSHKIENPVIFLDYIEEPYRDRVRLAADPHGEQRIAISDIDPKSGRPELLRLYPQPEGFGKGAFAAYHPETAMGAVFNRVRITHMDREGIDVQVIYGSLTLTLASLIDGDLATGLCRAYNNYIYDDCEPYRARLVPVGVLPLQNVSAALDEMRRCVEQLGMPAVTIAPNLPMPHPDAPDAFPRVRVPRHLSDPSFFPIYEEAERLGIAIGIHGTPGAYLCAGSADQVDTFTLAHLFGHRSQQQMAMAKLVMDGVLERFPTLRFGFLEAGCGWLPDMVHALHEHWEKRVRDFDPTYRIPAARFLMEMARERSRGKGGLFNRARNLRDLQRTMAASRRPRGAQDDFLFEHRQLVRNPEEYFARGQIFTTFEPDDPAPVYLRTALGPIGETLAGWSVDYGHWDGVLEDCVKRVSENPQIEMEYALRLLSTNTLRFYGPRLQQRIAPIMQGRRLLPARPLDEQSSTKQQSDGSIEV